MRYFNIFLLLSTALFIGLLASRFLISVSVIGFLILGLAQLQSREAVQSAWQNLRSNRALLATLGIFALTLLSGIGTNDFKEYSTRVQVLLPFAVMPLGFACFSALTDRQYKTIWAIFIYISTLFSVGVFINYLLDYEAIQESLNHSKAVPTPMNDHIRFSLLLCLGALMAGWLWVERFYIKFRWERALMGGLSVWLIVMLHLLSVRSGLLALYGCGAVLCLRWMLLKRRYILGLAGLVGILATPFAAYQFVPSFRAKIDLTIKNIQLIEQGEVGDFSDTQRLLSYKIAWRVAKDNLWLGVGMGNLRGRLEEIYTNEYPNNRFMFPHNQFLTYLTGTGIVGLSIFLFLFFVPLFYRRAYRSFGMLMFYTLIFSSFLTENTLLISVGVTLHAYFLLLNLLRVQTASEEEQLAKS